MPLPPGKIIRNKDLAGKTHPKTGIPFNKQGFPDFTSVARNTVRFKHTGDNKIDFATANRLAGFKSTPPGWTWHHHQNGRTMQLVPRHIHFRTGHTGSKGIGNLPGRKSERNLLELKMMDSAYEKAVADFEARYAISLPLSYRNFLVSGAWKVEPDRTIFSTPDRTGNPEGVLQQFYGLDLDDWSQDVVGTYEEFLGGIPDKLVPIGCDPGADLLFLDLREGSQEVVFWDHSHYWGTGEWREQDIYHVADSFEEFFRSLKPDLGKQE